MDFFVILRTDLFYNKKIRYKGNFGIWQYTDKGRIACINGNFDLDRCFVDYPKLIKAKRFDLIGNSSKCLIKDKKPNFTNNNFKNKTTK